MALNIDLPDIRFSLFKGNVWNKPSQTNYLNNLNYVYSKYNNIIVSEENNNLKISSNGTATGSEYDYILIKNYSDLYINRYETLCIDYDFKSYSNIGFRIFENYQNNLIPLTDTIDITENTKNLPIKYFTQDYNNENQLVVGITLKSSSSYVIINKFDIIAKEGDKMEYDDEVILKTYSEIEHNIYGYIKNLSGYPLGPSGLNPSGINEAFYRNYYDTILDNNTDLLYKEFDNIDYPYYNNTVKYTDELIDFSQNAQYNINMKVPQGYIYMLQFVLNDMTFSNNPSLELSGLYGDFNSSTYFLDGDVYDSICASGDTYSTHISGKGIKLHIPDINDPIIDSRNNKNYILKKLNILFMKFHNSVFDFIYNYVDYSGNYLGDSPFVQNFFSPPILDSGDNKKAIFEIIRRHTILHYQSLLINDVISRFVSPIDLAYYYKPNNEVCTSSDENENTSNKISIEFLELMRLITNLDQNQNQLYTHGPNNINKFDLYNTDNYNKYEQSGNTVSGINWAKFFKCSETIPTYSKKISPIINYSDILGNSLSGVSTDDIKYINNFFYFSNLRLQENSIASGQQIRKFISDRENKNLCSINESLFSSYDVSGLLSSNTFLEFTPFITYILYESDIFQQGSQFAQNGIASNILLRNFFKVMYNSIIDYTDIYILTPPILFDFINNSVDIHGNIRAGRVDDDNIVKTINGVYMRDIVRVSESKYTHTTNTVSGHSNITPTITLGSQQYYIFSINNFFDINVQKYLKVEDGLLPTQLDFYIEEDDYNKLLGFVNKLYAKLDNNTYHYIGNGKINGILGTTYYITLGFHETTPLLKNKKATLLMFSYV